MRSLPDVRSYRGVGVACYGPGRREGGISFGVFRVWREAWRCSLFSHTLGYGGRHGHEAPKDRAASEDMDLLVARGGWLGARVACIRAGIGFPPPLAALRSPPERRPQPSKAKSTRAARRPNTTSPTARRVRNGALASAPKARLS